MLLKEQFKGYGVFSLDVTAAMLVSQNSATAVMLLYQINPVGVEGLCKRFLLFP